MSLGLAFGGTFLGPDADCRLVCWFSIAAFETVGELSVPGAGLQLPGVTFDRVTLLVPLFPVSSYAVTLTLYVPVDW